MRILIDATPLLLRSAGVKNFVYYWLSNIRNQSLDDDISAFPFFGDLGRLDHEESISGKMATRARLKLVSILNARENHILDLLLGRRYDVFHASQQLRNPPRKCPFTATVYDMTCWLVPEMHTNANVAATKEYAERILRRANGLIAISECTRDDAVRILGLQEDSIQVIYPGVSEKYFQIKQEEVKKARQKYELSACYFLFVGCVEPRKNVAGILNAWGLLPPSMRGDCELIIAGPLGWEKTENTARVLAGNDRVRYLGYVPEEDLPSLIAGATGLLYPSFYEGFGFPVAQAMAAGTPVITSNVSCLPEIAGDAALLVNPRNAGEISDAMRQIFSSSSLRTEMRTRGIQRARRFRWNECARQSLSFFQKVVN
jgi:alpha-1,3-rhamnosyl/mannosyltransferase